MQAELETNRRVKPHNSHLRFIVLLLLSTVLVAEEARFGYVLGMSGVLCNASGGKYAPAMGPTGRCISRICYWFDDCGVWASPIKWIDRINVGDPESKVVFWLGEPHIVGGVYYWGRYKGSDRFISAKFRDGRMIELNSGD